MGREIKRRILAPGVGLSFLLALSGSGVAVTAISFAASGVTYALTDKGLSDNALSLTTGSNCVLFNFVTSEPICRDKPQPIKVASLAATAPTAGNGAKVPAAGDVAAGPVESNYRVHEGSTLAIDRLAAHYVELVGFAADEEFYALVQDDGALEVYAHDPSNRGDRANIRLVLRVDRYASHPDALKGVTVGGVFTSIKDIRA